MGGSIIIGALMGLGGTVFMDLWAIVLHRVVGNPRPNWAMVGRWAGHLPEGQIFHDKIADVAPVRDELRLGWAVHYGVGVIYGIVFAVIAGASWLAEPTFLPIWIYSILTIAAGWFLLHPGLGMGWAASKSPNPWKTRGFGLLAHTVFALGMWVVALVLGPLAGT